MVSWGGAQVGPDPLDDPQAIRKSGVHLLAVLRRRWWVPAGAACLAVAGLAALAASRPPLYYAGGLVQLGMYADRNMDSGDRRAAHEFFETHRGLLMSDQVIDGALEHMGVELASGYGRLEQRMYFIDGLEVKPLPETYLVQILGRGLDPRDVARRVNALMAAQVDFTNEFLGSRAVELERLRAVATKLQRELQEARTARDDLYGRAGDVADRRTQLLGSLQEARARLTGVDLDLAQAEGRAESVRRRLQRVQRARTPGELLGLARNAASAPQERILRVTELRARLMHMQGSIDARRLEQLPEYVALRDQLVGEARFLREELRQDAEAEQTAAGEQVDALRRWREHVAGLMERTRDELAELAALEDQHGALLAEVDWYERELEETRSRIRELQAGGPISGAEVINPADVPLAPVPRVTPLAAIGFLLFAIGAGLAAVVMWDRFEDTVADAGELVPFGLPILGRTGSPPSRWGGPSEAFMDDLALVRGSLARTLGERGSILVTEGHEGAGAPAVAIHLAAALARRGTRVVLVEARLRRPLLARRLHLEPGRPGLGAALTDGSSAVDLVTSGGLVGLHNVGLLLAGPARPDAAERLASPELGEILRELRRRWDQVIVLGPPAAPTADASLISPHVDGALQVVRLHRSPRGPVNAAIQQVAAAGGRNLGFVVTDGDAATAVTVNAAPVAPAPAAPAAPAAPIVAPAPAAAAAPSPHVHAAGAPAPVSCGVFDLSPATISRLEDRLELVLRRLLDSRLANLGNGRINGGGGGGEISRLERQIAGLMAQLAAGDGLGRARTLSGVQECGGLSDDDPLRAKKAALLQQVFDENMALQGGLG